MAPHTHISIRQQLRQEPARLNQKGLDPQGCRLLGEAFHETYGMHVSFLFFTFRGCFSLSLSYLPKQT